MSSMPKTTRAFTIVELLIVIVVIAIIATIATVAYRGIQDRARESATKADLSQAAKTLAADNAIAGAYPTTVNSDGSGNANQGKGLSKGSTNYEYTVDNTTGTFCLSGVNGTKAYHVTHTGTIEDGVCPGHSGPSGGGGIPAIACASLNIGDTGPGGGIIFYKTSTAPITCYEAAPAGWYAATAPNDPVAEWGCLGINIQGAENAAIGYGRQNTNDMLTANCSPKNTGRLLAVDIVATYGGGGKSDWYLPSKMELVQLCLARSAVGPFTAVAYGSGWHYISSTEWTLSNNNVNISVVFSGSCGSGANTKSTPYGVRPIRSF